MKKGDPIKVLFQGQIIEGTIFRLNKKTVDVSWTDSKGSYLRLIEYKNVISSGVAQ